MSRPDLPVIMRPRGGCGQGVAVLCAALLFAASPAALALTCQSNANGFWDVAGTWTTCGGGVPGAADDVVIRNANTVTIRTNTPAAVARSVTFSATNGSANLTHNSGIGLTVGTGGVTINAPGNNNTKAWNINAGTATVNGPVTLVAGGNNSRIARIDLTTGSLDINGDLTMTNSNNNVRTVISVTGAGTITLSGSFILSGGDGTLTPGTGTFTYDTAGAATVATGAAISYNNLTINKSGGTATASTNGNLTVGGALDVAAGTFDIGAITTTVSGTTAVTGTLSLSSATGAMTCTGDVTINGSGTWSNSGNADVTFGGNLFQSGTFTSGTGTYTFNGGAAQTLSGTAATTSFAQLTLSNANGLALTGSTSVTVTTLLTLSSGRITTNANTVYVSNGSAISGAGANTFIVGNLKKNVATGTNVSRTFEVGTESGGVAYAPLLLTFASVTTAGDITATTQAGEHPQVASSGIDSAADVNRYWTLTNSGVGSASTYDATFNFVAADVDAGASPALFNVQRYSPPAPAAGTWNPTTNGAMNTTSSQALGISAGSYGDFAVGQSVAAATGIGRFNAFETSTPAGALTGSITTKIAGTTGFPESTVTLDVIALTSNKKQIDTGFTGAVTVDLYNGATGSGTFDSQACDTGWTFIQQITNSFTFTAADNGRKTLTFAVAQAYPNARLRITSNSNTTVYGCSGDAFAIRPYAIQNLQAGDFDWTTATPVSRVLSNVAAPPGGTTHKAGQPFTVQAVAVNRAGATTTNYAGAPNAAVSACSSGAACTASVGTLTLSTTFASGQLSDTAASYTEAGAFSLQLTDTSFANVDATDSSAAERNFSSGTVDVGRFVPDHFALSLNTPAFGTACAAGSFTYVGQPFSYTTPPVITVTAQNAANGTTANYAGSLWQITSASLTGKSYTAATGTLDTSGITGTDPVINSAGSGTGTLTFGAGTGLLFARTTPVAPFSADVSLAINVIDADGVTYAANPARFGQATAGNGIVFDVAKEMRFGRLRLLSANGSQLIPLPVPMEAQYWNGSAFITNTADSCTTIAAANVAFGNYQANLNACETSGSTGSFSGGRSVVTLSAPGSGNNGSTDLTVNLGATGSGTTCIGGVSVPVSGANRSYLQGNWGGGAYNQNPVVRATFGVYRGADEIIYMRENY